MKIGIFDSGIGGLSVLHEAYHQLPDQEYIFYADVDHVPYGMKTPEQITGFVKHIVEFLMDQGCEAIVIACNTATAAAADVIRAQYPDFPILGMEPAVKPAVNKVADGRVLVMATPVTIRENKLHTLLRRVDEEHKTDLLAMPGFVEFAEREIFDGSQVDDYITQQTKDLTMSQYSELVLGCTHFNYFKPAMRKMFGGEIEFIDGNLGTIRHLADVTGQRVNDQDIDISFESVQDMVDKSATTYYMSGRLVTDEDTLSKFVRLHNRLESIRHI